MVNSEQIDGINQVVQRYFDLHPEENKVPVKDLMPAFIGAGIFPKDSKEGLPIRNVLRDLDESGQLHLIPYVVPERKRKKAYWFFARILTL